MAKGTIGAKLVLEGESKYKSALKEIKTAQGELRSEMKLCASEFKGSQNSLAALQSKYSVLGKQVEQAQRKYDTYNSALEEARKVQEELHTSLSKAQEDYGNAAKKMDELKTSASTSSEEMDAQQKILDQLGQEVADAKNKYDQCSKKVTDYQTALNYAGAELNEFKSEQQKTGEYVEEAEKNIKKCASSIDEYGNETEKASGQTEYFGTTIKANLASEAIISGTKRLVEAVKAIASSCIETGAAFEKSMSKVEALSGASGEDLQQLADKAREMGANTMYSASQAADALGYMALAGWDTTQMLAGIEPVLNLAAASDMELAEASDIVTDYITAFGLSAQDASKFADQMAFAMSKSNTSTEQLGEAYKNCAATAGSLGYTVEDTTAALMTMANAGVKGGEAGTGLSTIMTRLATNTKGCAKELAEYGVNVYDETGKMNTLSSILTGTAGVWETLTDKQQANLAKVIAGTSQYSKFQTIMSGLNDKAKESGMSFQDYTEALESCDGAAAQMAATMQDNLKGKLTIMQSALEACEESAYSLFDDALKDGVDSATESLTMLNRSITDGDMNVALSNMGDALDDFVKGAADAGEDVLPKLVEGLTWILENADVVASGITGVASAVLAYKGATEVAAIASKLLNTTIAAGPWGLAIAGIAGVASALAMLELTKTDSEMKQLASSASDLNTAIGNTAEKREENRVSIQNDAETVKKLVKELENENTTTKRKTQIVQELNSIMPELNLAYNEQKDTLSLTTEELEKNTDQLMKNMQVAAAQEDLTSIASDRYEAEKKLNEIMGEAADKYGMEADNAEDLAQKLRDSADAQEEFNAQSTLYTGMDAGYADHADDMRALADAIDETTGSMSALDEEYSLVAGYIDEHTSALQENTGAIGENTDAIGENQSATTQWSEEVLDAYDKAYKSVQSSLGGASEEFEKLGQQIQGTAEKSTTSLSDLQTQMTDWATGINSYAQSVATAEQIMSSDSNSAAYLQSIIDKGPSAASELDAVTDAYYNNQGAFQSLVDTYNQASSMLNSMAELEAGFSSGYTDAYTAGLEAIQENAPLLNAEITAGFDTEKQLIDEKTSELGSTMGEGISTGISDQAEEVKEAAQNLVDQNIVQTLQESAGVDGSASTKTIEIGQYIADGLVTGMQNNQANVIATAQNLASETYNQFQLGLSSDKFAEIGRQICNGLVSGINSGRSGVINAATKVAADAYEAAKKELDINSPSKKFAWLGKMSGEGYVEGLKKKMQSVKDVMAAAVPEASIGAAAGMKRGKASTGGQVINQTVNVYSKTDNLIDTARAFKQSQKEAARAW